MTKANPVAAAKAKELERARELKERAAKVANDATALRAELAEAGFDFAEPAIIAKDARRILDGRVRPTLAERRAARAQDAAGKEG